MTKHILVAGLAVALVAIGLPAQSPNAVRLQLAPGSQLSFTGTSTLHGFTCTTKDIQAYIDVDPAYRTSSLSTLEHPIVGVQVVIPVKSLACGGELEKNMFKTLNATEHPYITYKLSDYDVVKGTASVASFTVAADGRLAVSGKENPIALRVEATRDADGVITASGEQTIKMTDFGVKPPTFMLGALRVGNDLKIRFTLKATPKSVATAMTERNERLAMEPATVRPAEARR